MQENSTINTPDMSSCRPWDPQCLADLGFTRVEGLLPCTVCSRHAVAEGAAGHMWCAGCLLPIIASEERQGVATAAAEELAMWRPRTRLQAAFLAHTRQHAVA